MTKTYLQVPFQDKDEAKQLGAKWDMDKKEWYVPEGMDTAAFARWLPQPEVPNVRDYHYYIAHNTNTCWKCQQETNVYAVVLDAGHEQLDDEAEEDDEWVEYDFRVCLSFLTFIDAGVMSRINEYAPLMKMAYTKQANLTYFANHCDHCGAVQGDFGMHQEPGGAFCPMDMEDAKQITLQRIDEPFVGAANTISMGEELDGCTYA